MGQLTIYLDAETERKMKRIIKKRGVSKSKWISALIKERTVSTWPESISELAGAWADLPTAEEMRKKIGRDASREKL